MHFFFSKPFLLLIYLAAAFTKWRRRIYLAAAFTTNGEGGFISPQPLPQMAKADYLLITISAGGGSAFSEYRLLLSKSNPFH